MQFRSDCYRRKVKNNIKKHHFSTEMTVLKRTGARQHWANFAIFAKNLK
jgi:hypothetical protein